MGNVGLLRALLVVLLLSHLTSASNDIVSLYIKVVGPEIIWAMYSRGRSHESLSSRKMRMGRRRQSKSPGNFVKARSQLRPGDLSVTTLISLELRSPLSLSEARFTGV